MVSEARRFDKKLYPHKGTAEQRLLATDDRVFHAKIVSSALEFLGRFTQPATDSDVADSVEIFSWLPEIICLRAAATGKQKRPYALQPPKSADACNSLAIVFKIALGDIDQAPRLDAATREGKEEWLESRLAGLERSQRYVRSGDSWQWRAVPVLLSVEQCILYAIAVIHEDAWKLRDRVRLCPYRKRVDSPTHFESDHWFLDFEVGADAVLKLGAPRTFCTDEHGNAFRQREWRKQQAAAKHK